MAKLRWTQTQDVIELEVVNEDVYEYFIGQLNANGINQYTITDLGYASLSQELQHRFSRIQSFVKTRLHLTDFNSEFDLSDQDDLNHLHRQWVKLHQKHPNISTIANHALPGDMAAINKLIHAVEECTLKFEAISLAPHYTMPNPFGTEVLGFGTYNISIAYNNLGRSTWQKWQNNDTIVDSDLNNFDELYTTLSLNVAQIETRSKPDGYKTWCAKHNLPCVGNQMPLANFDRLDENLLQYRQMFYKNSLVENNFIILE